MADGADVGRRPRRARSRLQAPDARGPGHRRPAPLPRPAPAGDCPDRWASPSGRRSRASIGRCSRCAPRWRPMLDSARSWRKGGSHDARRPLQRDRLRVAPAACRERRARLPRRHPRPDRPHATATRLDLHRKVASHGHQRKPDGLPSRFPLRAIALVAILAVLLAAVVAVGVGSLQQRLPAPFGLAAQWAIAYGAADGDIHAFDPLTGTSRPLIAGPAGRRDADLLARRIEVPLRCASDGTLVPSRRDGYAHGGQCRRLRCPGRDRARSRWSRAPGRQTAAAWP